MRDSAKTFERGCYYDPETHTVEALGFRVWISVRNLSPDADVIDPDLLGDRRMSHLADCQAAHPKCRIAKLICRYDFEVL